MSKERAGVNKPIAWRRTFNADNAKMSTLSTKPHSTLVFIFTAYTKSTILSPVHVQCQTERVRAVTKWLKRKIACSVRKHIHTDNSYWLQTYSETLQVALHDASCLSVVSFNSTIPRAQCYVISYFRFRFTNEYNFSLITVFTVLSSVDKFRCQVFAPWKIYRFA